MGFFISNAVADTVTGAAGQSGSLYSTLILLVVFVLIFYFLMLRPQQKRTKAHNQLMSSLSKGDEVLTNGGLIARIVKVNENGYLIVELTDAVQVVIKRDFVTAVLPKGTMKSL